MALRKLFGPLVFLGLFTLASVQAGCTLNPVSPFGFRASDSVSEKDLPAGIPLPGGVVRPPSPPADEPDSSPSQPPPSSPLVVAMARAGSHYERGIQAMHSGNTDQAEWEFDAALEALLDTSLNGSGPAGLLGTSRLSSLSSISWLSTLTVPPRGEATTADTPPDPDEATLDAPALLDPEDLQSLAGTATGEGTSLPEPDIQKYEFPIVFNDQVKTFVQYFQTRKWGVITRAFERARRYLPMMRQVFREKGLPEELLNLAFIESAVNPWATSRAKAAGIWQFMASTARLHGMRVSWWVDERRDPEKATRGAATYLANLHRMFGSWPLALAAYNVGEGAVQRAIERQKTRNFWSLRLPKETKRFVPAFMAMTIISREPERYGFSPPEEEPYEVETVHLEHPADFRVLSQAARVSVERLRELNPELIRWATPPTSPRYALRIPAGMKADFFEELERTPPARRVSWIAHRVRKGETASAVAKRYGVSLQATLDMNGLSRRQPLKPGHTLLIPAPAPSAIPALAKAEETRTKKGATRPKAASRHVVKKGETLGQIARAHGVSSEDLRRWNNLSRNAGLKPGQALRLFDPTS